MFGGLKAYGETTKNHWGWAIVIIVALAMFGLGALTRIRTLVLRVPVVGPTLGRWGNVPAATSGPVVSTQEGT